MTARSQAPGRTGLAMHLARLRLLRPFRGRLTLGLTLLLATAGVQLSYPAFLGTAIDDFSAGSETELRFRAGVFAALIVLNAAGKALHTYLFTSTGSMVVARLRQTLFGAITKQEVGFFDTRRVGELSNRLASDVEQLQFALTGNLALLGEATVLGAGAAISMLALSAKLSFVVLAVVPPIVLLTRWSGAVVCRESKRLQDSLAHSGDVALEALSNIRLVLAFTRRRHELDKYADAVNEALAVAIHTNRLFAVLRALGMLVIGLGSLLTLWVGGSMVASGALSMGELTSFVLYAGMAASSISSFSGQWGEWMRALGATDEIFALLERTPAGRTTGKRRVDLRGSVTFEDVVLRYPGRPERAALDGFSLHVEAGQKVALVGASGAGKSSVASLLLGYYEPTEGRVLVDGAEMRALDIDSVREQIAVVEQDPALFSGTIKDNLRYGAVSPDIDDSAIVAAAREANVHEFVSRFPEGYETLVGSRGVQLSGGQKQRIAIARALLRDPKILILDEATSALDQENETEVQGALDRLCADRTVLAITHRPSTMTRADLVVELRAGKIVRQGPPDVPATTTSESQQWRRLA